MWGRRTCVKEGGLVGMEAVPEEAEVPEVGVPEVGGMVAGCAPDQAPEEAQGAEHL